MPKYSIGIDFGTLSGRVVLVDVETGDEIASAVQEYAHGVMEEAIPTGKKLPPEWALQHPQDYLDVLSSIIPKIIKESGVSKEDIIGAGVDFTACTMLPVLEDGTPLCFEDKFKNEPNAYVKLWKHHSAQDKANKINEIAEERNEKWLYRYGGKISSEWLFPKIWQTLDEAPDVYEEAAYFIEAGDWIVWMLTGNQTRNAAMAGYKATWHKQDGYPSNDFFKALDPRLENVVEEKLNCPITPIGEKAGEITSKASKLTGLPVGVSVPVAHADAHVAFPAVKVDGSHKMLDIIGTSSCHLVLNEEEKFVPGISGVVEDGIIPGYFGYEAGQGAVGDIFGWFVDNLVDIEYHERAAEKGIGLHEYLTEEAKKLRVGENGLIALDWWNGNRSTLVDADLSGLIVGMTLQTKPEDIYLALIEASAYGTRKIVENYRNHGVPINEFYAAGGIARKNPLAMQIYADVLNMPIKIGGSPEGPALASAIFGAFAAGIDKGGYDSIFEAGNIMGKLDDTVYYPNKENNKIYNDLYDEYILLYNFFGTENDIMKRIKKIKTKTE